MEGTNSNRKSFLTKKQLPQSEKHREYLGLDVPENYFASSKQSILNKIKVDNQPEQGKVIRMNSRIQYWVAASVAALLLFNLWLFNFSNSDTDQNFELLTTSENVLLNSLLLDEAQFESYSDHVLINEVVIKAELTEQKLDQFFINSLFVEDSLLENYTNDKFIETLIL